MMKAIIYALIGVFAFLVIGSVQAELSLDIGNDTDYEWIRQSDFTGPETLDVMGSLNQYVRGGCWCIGCTLDPVTENCTVPIVFTSDDVGNLTVDEVKLTFKKSSILGQVGYGKPFRISEGACWTVEFQNGVKDLPLPFDYNDGDCSVGIDYKYVFGAHAQEPTDDAVDDAMYRLLNYSLDRVAPKGQLDLDFNPNLNFVAEGKVGAQNLWGPLKMRLIVWA